jgi:alanyl-tRNA synthetase
MARERGLGVDVERFDALMNEQRARARAAQKKSAIEISADSQAEPTNFLGYDHDHIAADVRAVVSVKDRTGVIMNNSVCYAEMGGQVGDTGRLETESASWTIVNTQKAGPSWVHLLAEQEGPEIGQHVKVTIDAPRRRAIERHHSVTHLLHWALHQVVSSDATQKGSYVGPEKLTFDFSSAALTTEQKHAVEKLVNEKMAENAPVSWTEIPYAEAKKRTDIQQFFGDKYGENVRVVQIGGGPNELNGYSMELCGGTHVRSTGEIGAFRIVKEEAIAAGTRRIEAVAGEAAREWAVTEASRQDEKFEGLKRKKAELTPLKSFQQSSDVSELLKAIDERAAQLEKAAADVHDREKQQAKAGEAELRTRATAVSNQLFESHGTTPAIVAQVDGASGDLLQAVVDSLKSRFGGPIFLAGASDDSVALVAYVPKSLTAKFQAGKLIQEIAPTVGGKGGGRPENARGAGKDPSKIDEALNQVRRIFAAGNGS